MKINVTKLSTKIKHYETELKRQHIVELCTADHSEHIAAYRAWQQVGGNILVNNPLNPEQFQADTRENIKQLELSEPSIVFLTSGTTSLSKPVINTRTQVEQALRTSVCLPGWEPTDQLVTHLPAFTSGFWHIVLFAMVEHERSVVFSKPDCNPSGLGTVLCTSAGALDKMRTAHPNFNFTGYRYVSAGASQVLKRHAEYVFANGSEGFYTIYGCTETTTPILTRSSTRLDNAVNCYNFEPITDDYQICLRDGELLVKGAGVCANKEDFELTSDGWFRTGDYWIQSEDLVQFDGRRNDIVKMNGFKTNLLHVENIISSLTDLGDTLAVPRYRLGSDYLELFYTNSAAQVDRASVQNVLESQLSKCCIPSKFTHIDVIPRTALGKKTRANI